LKHVKIHPSIITEATSLSMKMGVLKGVVSSERKNIVGFIGELLHLQLFGGERVDDYDYDIFSQRGFKIDVKSSECTNEPKPFHVVKVFCGFSQQKCDFYSFFKIHKNWEDAWYVGCMGKEEFMIASRINREGSILKGINIVAQADQYEVEIKDLR